MIFVTSGNRMDVIIDYNEDGERYIVGLKPWDMDKVIPLPDPKSLIVTLENNIGESQ